MVTSRLVTPPSQTPISLAEAKAHLRIDHTDQDDLINALITAATEHVQDATGRILVTQTWEAVFDAFPSYEVPLSPGPVQSIESIKYDDLDGYEQTLAADLFDVDTSRTTAWIYSQSPSAWPSTMSAVNAVRVRFLAGYGDPADVPAPLKMAIRFLVAHWYENPGIVTEKKGETLPYSVKALLAPYRVFA